MLNLLLFNQRKSTKSAAKPKAPAKGTKRARKAEPQEDADSGASTREGEQGDGVIQSSGRPSKKRKSTMVEHSEASVVRSESVELGVMK